MVIAGAFIITILAAKSQKLSVTSPTCASCKCLMLLYMNFLFEERRFFSVPSVVQVRSLLLWCDSHTFVSKFRLLCPILVWSTLSEQRSPVIYLLWQELAEECFYGAYRSSSGHAKEPPNTVCNRLLSLVMCHLLRDTLWLSCLEVHLWYIDVLIMFCMSTRELADNKLDGPIPESFTSLTKLKYL